MAKGRAVAEQIVLVTGGASGISYALVEELLKNGVKAVVIADILEDCGKKVTEKFKTNYGEKRVAFIKTDVTDDQQFEAAFNLTISTYGTLNMLVNNAGLLKDESWIDMISVNNTAVLRGCFLAMKYMSANNGGEGGLVLNISSVLGLEPCAASPVYSATKHFIVGLTRSLGSTLYFEETGINFLVICPGITLTPALRSIFHNPSALEELMSAGKLRVAELLSLPPQTPEAAAAKIVEVILEGENGSIWVVEGGEAYEVKIPSRKEMRKEK